MDTFLLLAASDTEGPVFTVDRWGEGLVVIAIPPPATSRFTGVELEARSPNGGWAEYQGFPVATAAAVRFLPGAEYRFRDPRDTGAEVRVHTDLGVTTS